MSDIVKVYEGRLGDRGNNGENGVSTSTIAFSKCNNPVLDCLNQNNLGTAKFFRGGEAIHEDRYGRTIFVNDFDRNNLIDNSQNFNTTTTNWSDPNGYVNAQTTGQSDPLGGTNATRIQVSPATTALAFSQTLLDIAVTTLNDRFYTASFWIKAVSGTWNDSIRVNIGSDPFYSPWDGSTSWQRVSITLAFGGGTKLFGITPLGTDLAEFDLFGVQVEQGSNLTDYIATSGSAVTLEGTGGTGIRHNERGYLIENQSTNLATYSEDLAETVWTISGAALSTNTTPNPFGQVAQNQVLTMTNSTATITQNNTLSDNTLYYFSAYVKLTSGTVTYFAVSGCDGQEFELVGLTNTYSRITGTFTTGVDGTGDFEIKFISPDTNAVIELTGIQVEANYFTSYMRTAGAASTRVSDTYVTDARNLCDFTQDWSLMFKIDGVTEFVSKRWIIDNGENTDNRFQVYFENDQLWIAIGNEFQNFLSVARNGEFVITYESLIGRFQVWIDGVVAEAATENIVSNIDQKTWWLGNDNTATPTTDEALDGYLATVKLWDFELNSGEVRYVSGVY